MPTNMPRIAIIMRSYNDIDVIRGTFDALKRQTCQDFEVWNHDSSSSDGTLKVLLENNNPGRVLVNDPASYNPAKVLNKAVSLCRSEIIVFLNSDATPTSDSWLEDLIAPLADAGVGAVYGRQTARFGSRTLFIKDNERAFGDGRVASTWKHFFSMANSAARRSVLEAYPFATSVQYSEDIEWSRRLKKAGYAITYVAAAKACHSHNYSLTESWKRHFGEGKAEAAIFPATELNRSVWRYLVLPLGMEILRDMYYSLRCLSLDGLVHSLPLRFVQKVGRWRGLRAGLQALQTTTVVRGQE
ncbi:MAG: glycosyltransferase [Pseudomonadales bacterium]|nr:glycosyltransferase [Pseudomonadales bacterium]MDP4640861.1 glycosyltransferase [Pseudomonadales bacterium]